MALCMLHIPRPRPIYLLFFHSAFEGYDRVKKLKNVTFLLYSSVRILHGGFSKGLT